MVVNLQNGDKLTGVLDLDKFPIETVMGKLVLEIALVDRMTFSAWREGSMPSGEGDVFFGGVNWQTWRTQFEMQGDKLVSLPRVRPGFNYGHWGNGRGAMLATNIGNSDWRDYRVEFEYCVTGIDPAFNLHGLGADYYGGGFSFHVADAKESWNECGTSAYTFSLDGGGDWNLSSIYNSYCQQPVGFGNPQKEGERVLASGKGLKLDRVNGNTYRVELRGQRIQIWVDGEPVVDVTDDKMGVAVGGKTLDHGGFAVGWGWEAMGWIRRLSVTGL